MAKYWLFDFMPKDSMKERWQIAFGTSEIEFLGTVRDKKKRIYQWIDGANNALKSTKNGDTILCWFDLQAVILFYLSKLTFRKRKIVAQNIMLKFNSGFKGRLYKKAYQIAFKSNDFGGTVSSRYYGELLSKELGVKNDFKVVHDQFSEKYDRFFKEAKDSIEKKYDVFMGGNSSRDWKFGFEIAKMMPDVTFCFILKKEKLANLGISADDYPNVEIKCNVKLDEFNSDLYSSRIVMCPVTTECPAGLIIMYTAAAAEILFMSLDTATYKEYVTNDRGEILPHDATVWKQRIECMLDDDFERNRKGKNLHKWLLENCDIETCAKGLYDCF
ncbi:hypothetical protein SAMN02910384_00613 [Pseudobutyrivibrio sp. ACV-2]|uniref:hypothetical protein n=1 Tax=Pseudobutyrivibrio sp. ACV-2 TaxID=1520801 RepID=UPI00089A92C6|nr:hypothetical protein [Pseudobutyrivibrio sp. ACV-2]SEA01057.1 hypothetical protein SAMN02910384_00613 [Pseudobutyrivibrio sp. ACV-2]